MVLFSAADSFHGRELWKSDGTEAGTRLVKDLVPDGSSSPHSFRAFRTHIYFLAEDDLKRTGLWQTDGTSAGTRFVVEVAQASEIMGEINGKLMIVSSYSLWSSDGTAQGTVNLMNFGYLEPYESATLNQHLFFVAKGSKKESGLELWKTDGTAGGTLLVKEMNPQGGSRPAALTAYREKIYFSAYDPQRGRGFWRSDGTSAGTERFADVFPEQSPVLFNRLMYFSAAQHGSGAELWRSDGTRTGTQLVREINPGNRGSDPGEFTVFDGALFFQATRPDTGSELWKTDGTATGTVLFADLVRGEETSYPTGFSVSNAGLYFITRGGNDSIWLMHDSNSTPALLRESIDVGSGPVAFGNSVLFSAFTPVTSVELWISRGTPETTILLKDIARGNGGSQPTSLTRVGDKAFFTAYNGHSYGDLWKTDGTESGTQLIQQFNSVVNYSLYPTECNGLFFFEVYQSRRPEPWIFMRSDGTSGGTFELNAGGMHYPWEPTCWNDVLYFSAYDRPRGRELWRSDGTLEGTYLIKDISPGPKPSWPHHFVVFQNSLYFVAGGFSRQPAASAPAPNHLNQVWRFDGKQVLQLTHFQKQYGCQLAATASALVIFCGDRRANYTLFRSDGTPGGTRQYYSLTSSNYIYQLQAAGDQVFFPAGLPPNGLELWRTDGTTAGTYLVKDINPGRADSTPSYFAEWNRILYFSAYSSRMGQELWRSDGTTEGTWLVKDIDPGTASSRPHGYAGFHGQLYFVAGGRMGKEIWKTDGTPQGTEMAVDVLPGTASSHPRDLTPLGEVLLFVADDGTHGRELWELIP